MLLLQSLAVEKKDAPFSTCTLAEGGALDWSSKWQLNHRLSLHSFSVFDGALPGSGESV